MGMFGKRIRLARQAKGLTQGDIAKHFDIDRVSVTQWESDDGTNPAADKLPDLAALLGVSEDWLISNKGDAPEVHKQRSPSRKEEFDRLFSDLDEGDQEMILDRMRKLAGPRSHG